MIPLFLWWMWTVALAGELPPPDEVTLDDVLHLLRERSPEVALEASRIAIAEAGLVQARIRPNPELSYDGFFAASDRYEIIDGGQHMPVLSVPLLIGGKIPARTKAARKEIEVAQEEYATAFADLAREARGLWVELLARQEQVALLGEAAVVMARALEVVQQREALGVESRYEVTRLTVEQADLQARVAEAEAERQATAVELAALLGIGSWQPRAAGSLAPMGVEGELEALWEGAVARRPLLRAAEREVEAARARIKVARRDAVPTPTIGAGPFMSLDPKENHPFVGFNMEIPLFDRNQGEIARTVAEARAIELARGAVLARARGQLERSMRVLQTRREALARFEDQVGSRLPELRQMAEDAYRGGQGGILELLDALSTVIETQLDRVERIESVVQAELDVMVAAALVDVDGPGAAPR